MRSAVNTVAATAAVLAGITLAAGCSADGDADGAPPSAPPTGETGGSERPSPEQAAEGGMNGVWESTLDDSGIATLTVVGEDVRTEGEVACPGTLDPAESGSTAAIQLDCPDSGSRSGTAELNAEDDHLVVSWEESEFPEAFSRTGEEPVIEE
ncbi:hypothetical protein ACFQZ2_07635 [Streptomonospora algeriensis]|uniref:Lipoprotein n=1 Tax=Streptomonospora algeriensis TaxID=995084 RepID=A0ABW3BFA0_9ACTN